MNWLRTRRPSTLYAALLITFLLTRILFVLITTAGEYRLFKSYGDDVRRESIPDLYANRDIEYPQLAVGFGAVVGWVADHSPGGLKHIVRLRPNKLEEPYTEETAEQHDVDDQYEAALAVVLLVFDAWCLWLVFAIARRVYPDEAPWRRAGRLFLYGMFTGFCGLILFDRQDLLVAFAALVAMWFLAAGRPRFGYAVLALGAAYKLVPILLLPVWVIAAATVLAGPRPSFARWLRFIVVEALIAGTILAVWPILTYTHGGGERGFLYLTWHSKRGLQLEAPAAFPVLLVDDSVEFGASYGSFNLRGERPDRVAKWMGLMMPLTALACVGLAFQGFTRPLPPTPSPKRGGGEFPALMPFVIQMSVLLWLAFITFNKVGSPQYLLWIAPLIPLLPLRTRSEFGWLLLMLVAFIANMLIYPCRYKPDLVGDILYEDPRTWRGPTAFGVVLLGIKSVSLFVGCLWFAAIAWRSSSRS
jgi:hypothetical protein